MKPPKFYVGQAVVCKSGKAWRCDLVGNVRGTAAHPELRKVYTVGDWRQLYEGVYYISIVECPGNAYGEHNFVPVELLPDEALAELKELLEPVTA